MITKPPGKYCLLNSLTRLASALIAKTAAVWGAGTEPPRNSTNGNGTTRVSKYELLMTYANVKSKQKLHALFTFPSGNDQSNK